MAYIKEDQVLFDETLCTESPERYAELLGATIRFRDNIKLANHIASKYPVPRSGMVDKEDILQEAYLGLWKSCLSFDDTKGYEFSTFAVPTIKGTILHMLRDSSLLKEPRYLKDIRSALASHGFSLPLTDEEIDILIGEGKFSRAQLLSYNDPEILSIDSEISKGDSITVGDMIKDESPGVEDIISDDEIEVIVDNILKYIKPLHRDLVEEWIYATLAGEHLTHQRLSKKYKLSVSYVTRILNSAIDLIKMNRTEILSMFGI